MLHVVLIDKMTDEQRMNETMAVADLLIDSMAERIEKLGEDKAFERMHNICFRGFETSPFGTSAAMAALLLKMARERVANNAGESESNSVQSIG